MNIRETILPSVPQQMTDIYSPWRTLPDRVDRGGRSLKAIMQHVVVGSFWGIQQRHERFADLVVPLGVVADSDKLDIGMFGVPNIFEENPYALAHILHDKSRPTFEFVGPNEYKAVIATTGIPGVYVASVANLFYQGDQGPDQIFALLGADAAVHFNCDTEDFYRKRETQLTQGPYLPSFDRL